jgi:hypothetical protein
MASSRTQACQKNSRPPSGAPFIQPPPPRKRSDTARANRSPRVVRAAIDGLIDVLLEAEEEPAGLVQYRGILCLDRAVLCGSQCSADSALLIGGAFSDRSFNYQGQLLAIELVESGLGGCEI